MTENPYAGRRILIVEDDPLLLESLVGTLEDEGYRVIASSSVEEASEHLGAAELHLVVTDLVLPGENGLEMVRRVRDVSMVIPVLVMTAHASIESAIDAMKRGAHHYLQKPFDIETLLVEVQKALEHGQLLRERENLKEALSSEHGLGRLVGESAAIRSLKRMIKQVAATDSTVLITGETGTGKEIVANSLHYESPRAGGPFIKVNCAALSETLLESELFGHEKGAFTGADRNRVGKFERAHGGTIFLDEIAEMGTHVQAKLLRVLQGSEFERVGGDKPVSADVRVLAATNRDPQQAVETGKLRQDLYYRLNIVRIEVPPLRERSEDIRTLAEAFLAGFSSKHGAGPKEISQEAMDILQDYGWPGNVRELENTVERAVILAQGETLDVVDFPPPLGCRQDAAASAESVLNLQEMEKRAILRALEACGWNKRRAAGELGIYPASLYKKMKRFGIPLEEPQ